MIKCLIITTKKCCFVVNFLFVYLHYLPNVVITILSHTQIPACGHTPLISSPRLRLTYPFLAINSHFMWNRQCHLCKYLSTLLFPSTYLLSNREHQFIQSDDVYSAFHKHFMHVRIKISYFL